MEKRTFLGFDVTPRWALRQEIAILKWQLKDTHEKLMKVQRNDIGPALKNTADAITLETVRKSLVDAERAIDAKDRTIADLRARLAKYERPKDARGRFTKKTTAAAPAFNPPTVTLCGLEWMAEPLTGHGGTEILGRTYYTQDEAIEAAEKIGDGWRLPTKEEFKALADLGSTWVKEGPWGLPGRWFGGNHDTDHEGSLFFEASGYHDNLSGGLLDVGRYGSSWSRSPDPAMPESSVYGAFLNFSSGHVNPAGGNVRALGLPVRLVRDVQ